VVWESEDDIRASSIASPLMTAAAAGIAVGGWFYQPRWLINSLRRALPSVLFHVPTEEPVFALTFDDGPSPEHTMHVLDLLAEAEAHATFFVMGDQVRKYPVLARRIVEQGHELGNHLSTNRPAVSMSATEIRDAMRETSEVIADISGQQPRFVRPPAVLFRPSFLREAELAGQRVVLGSVYASDPLRPPRRYVSWAIPRMMRPGSIVVLHDGREKRQLKVDVLPDILAAANRLAIQPRTLRATLGHTLG
jgi:peptidoglycan-N-acetylglucosamine deacetylase